MLTLHDNQEVNMVQITMHVPEELAKKIVPIQPWLPAILEISLVGCKTLATAAATEVIRFLSTNPSPQEVVDFHVSERSQTRLRRLLALNSAGVLGSRGQLELDELLRLQHTIVMLKSQVANQIQPEGGNALKDSK
jgi:hypothetical protein